MHQTHFQDADRQIAENCIDKQIAALTAFKETHIRGSEYAAIVRFLKSTISGSYAQRIIVTGIGKNAHIAAKVSESMASLGIPSFYLNTAHCPHGDYGFIGPQDIIFHLSRSGKTEEMVRAATYLRSIKPRVQQVLVHCSDTLPASIKAVFHHTLFTGKAIEGDENCLAPTTSTTLILCAMDTITCILSSHLGFTREQFHTYHPGGSLGAMLASETQK